MRRVPLLLCLAPALALGCRVVSGPRWRAVDTRTNEPVDLEAMADELASADVVFLGERHDSDVGHELQLALTEKLVERRQDVVVSLEMFERDAQHLLDLYVSGAIDEASFLERARPWKNYGEHYRPVVELARERGLRVLAANCYRPLAARVAEEGRLAVAGDPWAAARIDAGPGPYREKFLEAAGEHAADAGSTLDRFFQAQCLKDATMAESIARMLRGGDPRPLVVHWCGSFHVDEGLGTVERLLDRVPDARVGIVTMVPDDERDRALGEEERELADYVWLVPE